MDYTVVADSDGLSAGVRGSLMETVGDSPLDLTQEFDTKLFSVNLDLVPLVLDSYKELNVKHEPLKLIPPPFDQPLPPLQIAVGIFWCQNFVYNLVIYLMLKDIWYPGY